MRDLDEFEIACIGGIKSCIKMIEADIKKSFEIGVMQTQLPTQYQLIRYAAMISEYSNRLKEHYKQLNNEKQT